MDILADRLDHDAQVVHTLGQTCKGWRQAFRVTDEMEEVLAWLDQRDGGPMLYVEHEGVSIFLSADVIRMSRNSWRLSTQSGRKSAGLIYHDGLLRIGKCAVSLVMHSYGWGVDHMSRAYGLLDLDTVCHALQTCAILAHELPENVTPLAHGAVFKHRQHGPWDARRAFYTWRAARKGYETWNGGRNHDEDGSCRI